MATRCRGFPWFLLVAGALGIWASTARGQAPTIDTPDVAPPGSGGSPFGKTPGAGGQGPPGPPDSLLGGRLGPGAAKGIPTSISNPGMSAAAMFTPSGISRTPNLPPATIPAAGPLSMPPTEEDPGPADGMTLDQAIDLLIKGNLDLAAKFYEIPQAKADILTASLRANPVFYADTQLVPYGQYTRDRPGGQTQYDVNISYPLDLSGKRKSRTASAIKATKVVEAQYQDAVRQSIDNLYSGYVDLLQARRTIAFSKAAQEGLARALAATQDVVDQGFKKRADVQRIRISLRQSQQQILESQEAYSKAKQALATLLNVPAEQAEAIEPRGTLNYPGVVPPPLPELIAIALNNRPDVISYRLGLGRAKADVQLQLANRFQDVYVLYQPYTLQDNTPFGLKSPTSWALGVTIPLPLYNRNQGNIQRAKLNVNQTNTELDSVIRQAVNDVQLADLEYRTARAAVDRNRDEILPDSTAILKDAQKLFPGEIDVLDYLAALRDYNENARTLLDSQVRLRRAMLNINTVVGQRVLP